MAAQEGLAAFGTKLQVGAGEPAVYTTVAGVVNITGPSIETNTIEITNHNSPGGYAEFVTGIKNPGDVSIELNFLPEEHSDFVDLMDADVGDWSPTLFRILYPTGDSWDFSAIVASFESDAPVDGKLTASLTLRVSGKPTLVLAP